MENVRISNYSNPVRMKFSHAELDRGGEIFRVVAESGGLLIQDRSEISALSMTSEGKIPGIWIGQGIPPQGYHSWVRRCEETGRDEALRHAFKAREQHNLEQVAVLDIPAPSLNGTYHLLIGQDSVLRCFQRETDLYAHMVDEMSGVL